MDAVAEREVTGLVPVDVELLGACVSVRIPVRRSQADDHLLTGWDLDATERERQCGVAKRRMRDGCVVAEELLYRSWDPGGVGAELGEVSLVAQQRDDPVANEAGGCVVTGDD